VSFAFYLLAEEHAHVSALLDPESWGLIFWTACTFLVVLAVLSVDSAYTIFEWLLPSDALRCSGRVVFFTVVCYLATGGVIAFLFYAGDLGLKCILIVAGTGLTILIVSVVSALDKVERGSLFVSSVISFFMAALVGPALVFDPSQMNPLFTLIDVEISAFIWTVFCCFYVGYGALHFFVSHRPSLEGTLRGMARQSSYSLFKFHMMFALATLFTTSLATFWQGSFATVDHHVIDGFAFWAKVVAQILTGLLYFWSLVAPLVLPNSYFERERSLTNVASPMKQPAQQVLQEAMENDEGKE